MEIKGENIRNNEWYLKFTDKLISKYVNFKKKAKDGDLLRVELIFSYRKGKNERQRLLDACAAFGCDPWIAVYVETLQSADLYFTSLEHYDKEYRGREGRAWDTWRMTSKYKTLYEADAEVKHIKADFHQDSWGW